MPSKRERGKQRKAAKDNSIASATSNAASQAVVPIQRGETLATKFALECRPPSYADSGILPSIFGFLKRCEESFAVVIGSVRGDLNTPVYWIKLLSNAIEHEPSCRLTVVQNIGPLVKCMCEDSIRLFFKSNKHWKDSIVEFTRLISRLIIAVTELPDDIESSDQLITNMNEIVDTLLQHEGLFSAIIQWGFWGEDLRPDIMKDLDVGQRSSIFYWGMHAAARLVRIATDSCSKAGYEKRAEAISTTPIVSKDYDSTCAVSFVAGLIKQLKAGRSPINNVDNKKLTKQSHIAVLIRLIEGEDYIDKEVVIEMISYGLSITNDLDAALFVARMTYFMMTNSRGNDYPSDTRIAFAVRSGLVEMCFSFIERFGQSSFFRKDNVKSSLYDFIYQILDTVHDISLHGKTAKAIRSKRDEIEEGLLRLERKKNTHWAAILLSKVRFILNLSGMFCCRCCQPLDRKSVKQCNGCSRMTYCSKACQKEDWIDGHDLSCNKTSLANNYHQFQGTVNEQQLVVQMGKSPSKLKELETNVMMIQLKMFLDHSEAILKEARLLDIKLYDCVVLFELRCCPPTVKTSKHSSLFPYTEKDFEKTRSKDHITCIYLSSFYNGESDADGRMPHVSMQRLFPCEWLLKK